jgi:hypothetical protein
MINSIERTSTYECFVSAVRCAYNSNSLLQWVERGTKIRYHTQVWSALKVLHRDSSGLCDSFDRTDFKTDTVACYVFNIGENCCRGMIWRFC